MKKILLVLITFAFISGSFANDLSNSVVEKKVKSKIETLSTLSVTMIDEAPLHSNRLVVVIPEKAQKAVGCSASINYKGIPIVIWASTCAGVASILGELAGTY